MLFRNSGILRHECLHCKSGSQQRSYRSGCSSQSDGASCKPSSLLFSYYTSRVYPAGCGTPCRAGFGVVRFAFGKRGEDPRLGSTSLASTMLSTGTTGRGDDKRVCRDDNSGKRLLRGVHPSQ